MSFAGGGGGPAGMPGMPGGMPGMPPGGMPQLMAMMAQMPAEQRAALAQQMGMQPQQMEQMMAMMQQMPPEQMAQLMQAGMAGMGGPGGPGGGMPPGANVVQLTQEEADAIERLVSMGFDKDDAVQAFLACDKNEMLAANLLMDDMSGGGGMMDFADDAPAAPAAPAPAPAAPAPAPAPAGEEAAPAVDRKC